MITIRPMRPEDNAAMLRVIQQCVLEFGYTHSPYIIHAEEEGDIYGNYADPRARMYVLEDANSSVIGGGGFAPLADVEGTCEIMQVYFSPKARGFGLGKTLVKRLMDEAAANGFEHLYIETVPEMQTAIRMYQSFGFTPLPERKGCGGHNVCSIFMQRPADLQQRSA